MKGPAKRAARTPSPPHSQRRPAPRAPKGALDALAASWGLERRHCAALIGILALTAVAYLRCLGNGFVFDDHEMILINRYIGQWSFLWKAFSNDSWWFRNPNYLPQSHYYRPLQDLWLGLNYHLFGTGPLGWHALMVLLHLGAVLLAFRIASQLAGDRTTGLLAALFFGLLPVHAEAVIWATAIPESLAGFLELGSFALFLAYRRDRRPRTLGLSLACFGGALLSHEGAIAYPAVIGAWALFFTDSEPHPLSPPLHGWRGGSWSRLVHAAVAAAPFLVLALFYLGLRVSVLGFVARRDVNNHASLAQILLTIPAVIETNLVTIAWPWAAGPSHRIDWVREPALWSGFALPLAGIAGLALSFSLLVNTSPARRLYWFAGCWIVLAMGPVLDLGILYPQALVADRYLYFASFGWCLILGAALASAARALSGAPWPAYAAVAGMLAAPYGIALWQVQRFWHDEIALFSECIERFPENGFCHNRLGMALAGAGDLAGGDRELSLALKFDPADWAAEYNLGNLHRSQGRGAEAAREISDALAHLPQAPASAHIGLAELYDSLDQPEARDLALSRAARTPGGEFAVAVAHARIDLAHKDGAAAQATLEPLLAQQPENPALLTMAGMASAEQGDYQRAAGAYQRAASLAPADPATRYLLAAALHQLGRDREALYQARVALRLAPDFAKAAELSAIIAASLKAAPADRH